MALAVVLNAHAGETSVIEHARVIPSATAAAVEDGTVVVRDGRIAALGPSGAVPVPAGARRVDGAGATVLPGFWNVHVHFTEERFADAAHRPAEALSQACRDMLTSHGFTTVVDLGSFAENTVALRGRAASLDCPRILTTGLSMYPGGRRADLRPEGTRRGRSQRRCRSPEPGRRPRTWSRRTSGSERAA